MHPLKQTFFISVVLLLSACNQFQSKKEALEEHYEEALEKDYNEYKNSPQCLQFAKRYEKMLEISKTIADNPPVPFHENGRSGEILCMGLVGEMENEANWERWQAEQKKVTYNDFVNLSKKVTAILVSNTFYKKEGASEIGLEGEIHAAYKDMHNPNFLREKKRYGALSYRELCNRRITIDKVNNSKFMLILDQKRLETYDYLSKKTVQKGEFQESQYEGLLYIYSFEKNKTVQALKIYAASSDTIDPGYRALDEAVRKDLEDNVKALIRQKLDSLYIYKGTDPELKIH